MNNNAPYYLLLETQVQASYCLPIPYAKAFHLIDQEGDGGSEGGQACSNNAQVEQPC